MVSFRGSSLWLIVQLEGELDLARIVGIVARGTDQPKVATGEVGGATNGDDSITAKSRGTEVGMIHDVEELGAKLTTEPIAELDVLEQREVQAMKAGSNGRSL